MASCEVSCKEARTPGAQGDFGFKVLCPFAQRLIPGAPGSYSQGCDLDAAQHFAAVGDQMLAVGLHS
eukprot:9320520-Prorocentrum_lima.AAC.1